MPKLTRYLQKIFANNSNQVGVFGTGVDKETSKNVETLQSADYENGWSSAIITNKNYPIWQEMDGVQYGLSYQLKYLFQNGIPEWLSTETYYTNSYCRYGSDIYYSLQDDNTNHNPALNDGWWIIAGGADINLSNLTTAGNAKLQYAPFAINAGTVTDGENATLYCPTSPIQEEVAWTQPILSSNGTIGGDSFAVYTSASIDSSNYFWLAFDNNSSTFFRTTSGRNQNYIFYHPTGLKVSSIKFIMTSHSANEYFTAYEIYGSDDNSSYILIKSGTSSGSTQTISVDSNNFYKYYKFIPTSLYNNSYPNFTVNEIQITATYMETIAIGTDLISNPCTITTCDGRTKSFDSSSVIDCSSQADGTYNVLKDYSTGALSLVSNLYIGKNGVSWTQPTLSANGTMGGDSFAVSASSEYSSNWAAWKAFNGVTTGSGEGWTSSTSNAWIAFYNPIPLKVSQLKFTNVHNSEASTHTPVSGTIYGSDDNSTWAEIKTFTNTNFNASGVWSVNVDSPAFYNYYKIECTSNGAETVEIWEIEITAKQYKVNNLNISTIPANLYINGTLDNDKVYLGDVTVESNVITAISNRQFNDSGYLINRYYPVNCLPDWDNKIDITAIITTFTCPSDGILYLRVYSASSTRSEYGWSSSIAGGSIYAVVAQNNGGWYTASEFIVRKDEVLTYVTSSSGTITGYFIPFKGV